MSSVAPAWEIPRLNGGLLMAAGSASRTPASVLLILQTVSYYLEVPPFLSVKRLPTLGMCIILHMLLWLHACMILLTAGTAVLQIGTGLVYVRYLTLCDGGVYTCVARPAVGGAVRRNFSLLIGCESVYTMCACSNIS